MWAELIPGQLDIATWLLMRTHLLPILISGCSGCLQSSHRTRQRPLPRKWDTQHSVECRDVAWVSFSLSLEAAVSLWQRLICCPWERHPYASWLTVSVGPGLSFSLRLELTLAVAAEITRSFVNLQQCDVVQFGTGYRQMGRGTIAIEHYQICVWRLHSLFCDCFYSFCFGGGGATGDWL